ncbi:MAG: transcription termination/antitermination protein NusG, partial [Alphaproteobacteria bacterium]|nr:transcription termination/antitermination protein NusG [Alphaproteobacteria bacterium]
MAEGHHWYVVHVYSGFEKKVAEAIEEQAKKKGLQSKFSEVLVPTEDVIEIRRGNKVNAERKFFPGYVLVKMDLKDETWHLVTDVPKVTGFLGARGKPSPISEAEAQRILTQVEEGGSSNKMIVHFSIGEQVRVCDGPFNTFNGVVEDIEEEKTR